MHPLLGVGVGNFRLIAEEITSGEVWKIAHNPMFGVVIQTLCEITVLAEKAGIPRHLFLEREAAGATDAERIDLAYRLALSRPSTDDERRTLEEGHPHG